METSVTNQAYIFLASIAGGLSVGFIFDIFRVLRQVIKPSNIIIYLQDILFWIIVTIIIFTLIFMINHGELRWYEFIGIILGVIFYNLLFSIYIVKTLTCLFNFIKHIFNFIKNIILFPFIILYKIFRKPFKLIIKIYINICKFIKRFIKKIIKKTINNMRFSITNVKKRCKRT